LVVLCDERLFTAIFTLLAVFFKGEGLAIFSGCHSFFAPCTLSLLNLEQVTIAVSAMRWSLTSTGKKEQWWRRAFAF
jgi:hypothetical protein